MAALLTFPGLLAEYSQTPRTEMYTNGKCCSDQFFLSLPGSGQLPEGPQPGGRRLPAGQGLLCTNKKLLSEHSPPSCHKLSEVLKQDPGGFHKLVHLGSIMCDVSIIFQ